MCCGRRRLLIVLRTTFWFSSLVTFHLRSILILGYFMTSSSRLTFWVELCLLIWLRFVHTFWVLDLWVIVSRISSWLVVIWDRFIFICIFSHTWFCLILCLLISSFGLTSFLVLFRIGILRILGRSLACRFVRLLFMEVFIVSVSLSRLIIIQLYFFLFFSSGLLGRLVVSWNLVTFFLISVPSLLICLYSP